MAFYISHKKNRQADQAGWNEGSVLEGKRIDEIQNPDSLRGEQPIRSIPTPFAPMHLTKEAMLRYVNGDRSNSVKMLISGALDVGVLFFTLGVRGRSELDCVRFPWSDLPAWRNAGNDTRRLASAIDLHHEQDQRHYGFAEADGIYLLHEKNVPARVLGGTCPETLFFAAAGKRASHEYRAPGGDVLFDASYQLIHERFPDFQRWMYCLFANLKLQPGGSDTAMAKYLAHALIHDFTGEAKATIEGLIAGKDGVQAYNNDYQQATTTDGQLSQIQLYRGLYLHQADPHIRSVESDFHMKLSVGKSIARPPLALPQVTGGSYKLVAGEAFNQGVHRPRLKDPRPLAERTLPGLETHQYPYLTVDDLLEPHLVKVPYPIDNDRWMSVLASTSDGASGRDYDFLLPLKPAFFEYFTVADLLSSQVGTPKFSLKEGVSYTTFSLEIPLRGGNSVTFAREYSQTSTMPPADGSKGAITEMTFGLAMFPEHVDQEQPTLQRMMLSTAVGFGTMHVASELQAYYSDGSRPTVVSPLEQTPWLEGDTSMRIYEPREAFDHFRVQGPSQLFSGIVVPRKFRRSGTASFSFAVDFGTSNTHVEVSRAGGASEALSFPEPFGITATLHPFNYRMLDPDFDDVRIRTILYGKEAIAYQHLPEEYLPTVVAKTRDSRRYPIQFPIRTATVETKNSALGLQSPSRTICIPWSYQVVPYNASNQSVQTNLKWRMDAGDADRNRVRAFIGTLCLAMRAHVLQQSGSPAQTKLIWFYPTSMPTGHREDLTMIWRDQFRRAFPEVDAVPLRIAESVAPYHEWLTRGALAGDRATVSIDIGGGTADVAVFRKGQIMEVKSYQYAGDAVFGSGRQKLQSNGFYLAFKDEINRLLASSPDLTQLNNKIIAEGRAEDVINFWFSLGQHPELEKQAFNFAEQLARRGNMKVPVMVYFASLIYRTAHDLEASERVDGIGYLAFSGNGSRMLQLLTSSNSILREFFNAAYNTALEMTQSRHSFEVMFVLDKPKEITAKGGLSYLKDADHEAFAQVSTRDMPDKTLKDLDEPGFQQGVMEDYRGFLDFMERLRVKFNFDDRLSISRQDLNRGLDVLRDLQRVEDSYVAHVEDLRRTYASDKPIGEDPFFFAFKVMIPEIARQMAMKS